MSEPEPEARPSRELGVVEVTKLEAAERQLQAAAHLFMTDQDPVAIHTLVGAAFQVLSDLASRENRKMQVDAWSDLFEEPDRTTLRNALRFPQNYFKHADRPSDPEKTTFSPELTSLLIMDAALELNRQKGSIPVALLAFGSWYSLENPHRFQKMELQALYAAIKVHIGLLTKEQFYEAYRGDGGQIGRKAE